MTTSIQRTRLHGLALCSMWVFCLFALASPSSAVWHTETVDSARSVGYFTSLTFNATGPAISYYDGTNHTLKFAWQESGVWYKETVDSGYVGSYTSLAFNTTGYAISYFDSNNCALKFAWQDSEGWHNQTVDSGSVRCVGEFTSLAFNITGYPAISYEDLGSPNCLKYAWQDTSGVWHNLTIDTNQVGYYTSLAFNNTGYPAISYFGSASSGSLKYAWQDSSGVWHNETIDNNLGYYGGYTSLAFNNTGYPAISYWGEDSNGALKYAWQDSGGVWHNETVDDNLGYVNDGVYATSLKFNTEGPAISYFNSIGKVVKYAWQDNSGVWHKEAVDDNLGAWGGYTSLAFSLTGETYPAISYFNASSLGSLKYAWWTSSTPGPDPGPGPIDVNPPGVKNVVPPTGSPGSSFTTTVTGSNFMFGASPTVTLTYGGTTGKKTVTKSFKATHVKVMTPSQLTCQVKVPADAMPGTYTVTLKNGDGQTGSLKNAFTVTSPTPVITLLAPDKGVAGKTVTITSLSGRNFTQNAKVFLKKAGLNAIAARNVKVVSSGKITCLFSLPAGTAKGKWDIVVKNPDGKTGEKSGAFTVR